MLQLRVIEPSHSVWRSPIILMLKPDGSIRFCVDYHEVNKLAPFDAYPMPQADILIGQLGQARFISAIDLTKGYWQVPVKPQDRETRFPTPSGLFQFRQMPFGLHGAAATFQRLVDRAPEGCEAFAREYIDDIIISSSNWEEHLQHLHQVLQALNRVGLKVNPSKSRLGFQELKYLGYMVGKGCLKPLPDKVLLPEEHPRPTTKKHLQQFLGFVGYYSRFIPHYTSLASTLTRPHPMDPSSRRSFRQFTAEPI